MEDNNLLITGLTQYGRVSAFYDINTVIMSAERHGFKPHNRCIHSFYEINLWFYKNFQIYPPAVLFLPLQTPDIHLSFTFVSTLAL